MVFLPNGDKMKYIDYVKELHPNFEVNWHHKIICDEIDKWLLQESGNLMVLAPPRSSKSTLSSKTLPAYIQEYNIASKVLCATYSNGLASQWLRNLRKIQINRNLSYDRVNFIGVGQQLTGCQYDLGIMDDLNKPFGDTDKTLEWYISSYLTRFGFGAKQLVICSSMPNCVAKYILDRARIDNPWTVVRIPAMFKPFVTTSNEMEKLYWDKEIGRAHV